MEYNEKGIFLQVPVFILDTCDLPDTHQMVFLRLLRELRGGKLGNTWQGSKRKLAKLTRVSVGTAFTVTKNLAAAGLFEVEDLPNLQNNADSLILHLKIDEIWKINALYCSGTNIERWKVLPTHVLEGCSNFEQGCAEIDREGDQILNTSRAQTRSNSEQGVFKSSAQSRYIDRGDVDNRDYSNRETDKTASQQNNKKIKVVLTEEQSTLLSRWCEAISAPVEPTETIQAKIALLLPYNLSVIDLRAIVRYALENDTKGYYKKRGVKLWDIPNELAGWRSLQLAPTSNNTETPTPPQNTPICSTETEEERRERLQLQAESRFMQKHPKVFWTTTGKFENKDAQDLETLLTWSWMPVTKAVQEYAMPTRDRFILMGSEVDLIYSRLTVINKNKNLQPA